MEMKLKSGTSILKQCNINTYLGPKEENGSWQQHVTHSTFCCQVERSQSFPGLVGDAYSQTPTPKPPWCRLLGREGMPSQSREPPRKLPPSPGKSPQTLSRVRLSHILLPEPHHRQESYLCSAGSPSAELPKPPMTRTAAPYPTFPQQQQQSSESTWIKPKKKKKRKEWKKRKETKRVWRHSFPHIYQKL